MIFHNFVLVFSSGGSFKGQGRAREGSGPPQHFVIQLKIGEKS